MDKWRNARLPEFLLGLALLALTLVAGGAAQAAEEGWPRRYEHPKGTVTVYQPQLETFQGDKLTARAAVSFRGKNMKEPHFGVLWFTARVSTDRDTRLATIDEPKITEVRFPEAKPEQIEQLKEFLNHAIAGRSHTISLDRLLAMMETVEREKAGDRGLNTTPPRIIFVTHPAVLVLLDGDPKLRPLEKSTLMRVVNTPFVMVFDPASKAYYLKGDTWLTAADVKGPWKDAGSLPQALKTWEAQAPKEKGPQPAQQVAAKTGKMPEVLVSTTPAELIVSDGEPDYTPITGTNLLYLSNTESNVFLDLNSQQYYVLLAGRWFQGKSLTEGPWTYVAPDRLPGDFAKIPPASAKGFVRVSVAGTQEAKEAVMDNYIPQTAAIDRKKATTQVQYDGAPKFDKIPQTDLEYAVNTGQAVFKEGTKYYACDQGVWYEADSPNGPWKAAVTAPRQVQQIPPSNPHYNVKYVQVYDSTDDVVYMGYTPGYTESYVQDGTVVYGTGYDYPAYASNTAYIPYPATYGFAPTYNPYAGSWGYQPPYDPYAWLGPALLGFGAGVAVGAAVSHWWGPGPYYGGGWWGPGGYNNININNIHNNVIHRGPWGPGPPGPPHPPGPPGPPGPHGRPIIHPVYGPGPGHNIYNRPGNRNNVVPQPATRPASQVVPAQHPGGPPGRPGQVSPAKPGVKPAQPTRPQAKPAQARATTGKPGQNNVYADKHGQVYRQTPQGWQQRQGNNWSKPQAATAARPTTRPERPATATPRPSTRPYQPSARPSFDSGQLNREFGARQRGEMRTQNFQRAQSPSFSRPAGGGAGGFRGGGGGGGRRR